KWRRVCAWCCARRFTIQAQLASLGNGKTARLAAPDVAAFAGERNLRLVCFLFVCVLGSIGLDCLRFRPGVNGFCGSLLLHGRVCAWFSLVRRLLLRGLFADLLCPSGCVGMLQGRLDHLRQSFQGNYVPLSERIGAAREKLENAIYFWLADKRQHHHRRDSQRATALTIHPWIDLRIVAP